MSENKPATVPSVDDVVLLPCLTARAWGASSVIPLLIRENEEGDVDFTTNAESINADVILHGDDARKVGQWLIEFAGQSRAVFACEYCYCICESTFEVMSLHGTKGGAYREMMRRKNQHWHDARDRGVDPAEIGWMEAWQIKTYAIVD